MLEIGSKAPDFTLTDQNGITHSLMDYRGQKDILYFYPKDNSDADDGDLNGLIGRSPEK